MAALSEIAPRQVIDSRLQRPNTPFIEDLRHKGWPCMVEIRHEYPIHVGLNREGLGVEVWRQYIKDPNSQLGEMGSPFKGWTGQEIHAYKGFKYEIARDGKAGEIVDDIFLRDRRAAADLDLPIDVLDQMFDRPARGIPWVEYVDTAAGRVIKQIHFE